MPIFIPSAPRTPWPSGFPPVIGQSAYATMRDHPAYRSAKDGESADAALTLALDLVSDDQIAKLRSVLRAERPRVVAVHANEATGRNKIPVAYGEVLAQVLGLPTDPGIVQATIANHGGATSVYHRMVSQPSFDGFVEAGAPYLIIDDTCTLGGTLANLKGYIETNGGRVVGMSVLGLNNPTLSQEISIADMTIGRINIRHSGLDRFWREEFGYGINALTEGEAGHLFAAPNVDTIRNRLAEARRDLNLDGDQGSNESAISSATQNDPSAHQP